ncbi:hypothetical protein ENHAE0001_1954 [Enhydrobacter aerosaccus SK60]|nr:hypothetical protein ENHAE0001_1954 [Enhydrobacter aerosaccus SK60]
MSIKPNSKNKPITKNGYYYSKKTLITPTDKANLRLYHAKLL